MGLSLRDSFELHVEYNDSSPFGTVISGQLEARLKRRFEPIADLLRRNIREAVQRGTSLLAELALNGSRDLYGSENRLHEDFTWPDARQAKPAVLRIDRPNSRPVKMALPDALVPDLASWIGEWQRDAVAPASSPARDLWDALSHLDCFGPSRKRAPLQGAATFVGHATVLLSTPRTKILIDPFLLPGGTQFPADYQPLTHADLLPDAILVTHSHLDHFHVDSLLRLGKDTPIFVPEVARESALSIDMVYRLKELGFTRVRHLGWHEETAVGDFRIIALPFYGEQPTMDAVPEPEIRNLGNNYLIEGGGRRYALIADAGRDYLGDVRGVATAAFERYGAIDILFGGYRSWSLYPIQYATTSVPQYLLVTPASVWGSRQQIMNDEHDLLDTAERWHARYVVPYANGGAPWYWQLGLGPRLDGGEHPENVHFDPRPEAVLRAAASRSEDGPRFIPSPVKTLILRPGESVDFDATGAAVILANEGLVWPYPNTESVLTASGAASEPLGLTKKRVLLRLLATEEIKRRGLTVSVQQIQEMSDDLRLQNGLMETADMLPWLERAGLSMAEYCEILLEWQAVIQLEDVMADAIEKRLAGQRSFASMRKAARA